MLTPQVEILFRQQANDMPDGGAKQIDRLQAQKRRLYETYAATAQDNEKGISEYLICMEDLAARNYMLIKQCNHARNTTY